MSHERSSRPPSPSTRTGTPRLLAWSIVVAAIGAFVLLMMLPAFQSQRNGRRSPCINHVKQIALALQNYHEVHGSFPPAITYGPDGEPWHSWRTLLMPFLDQPEVYARYRFDEPWNSPHNSKLAVGVGMISIFHCPKDEDAAPGETSYVAVIGERTMWPPDAATTRDDAIDGEGNTLHVVEVSDSGVHWMEPKDLRLSAMTLAVGADQGVGIRGRHGGTERWFAEDEPSAAAISTVDGRVQTIGGNTPPETVRSLILRDDGGPAEW